MLSGIWFYIQLHLVAITVNLLIRAHPSISVSSHKRLWHFVITQITLNPAKCVISTRSRKFPQEAHSHLARSRLSCWLPSKWHPYLHDFAFQGYLMCHLDWGAVDSRDHVYHVQIAEEHLTCTSCCCCGACISWPTIVVRCSGVNCCIWESTAGGRLKGIHHHRFRHGQRFRHIRYAIDWEKGTNKAPRWNGKYDHVVFLGAGWRCPCCSSKLHRLSNQKHLRIKNSVTNQFLFSEKLDEWIVAALIQFWILTMRLNL